MRMWPLVRNSMIGLMLCSACTTTPVPPCPCEQAIEELSGLTEQYHRALRDKGVLRQQLKACQEKRL